MALDISKNETPEGDIVVLTDLATGGHFSIGPSDDDPELATFHVHDTRGNIIEVDLDGEELSQLIAAFIYTRVALTTDDERAQVKEILARSTNAREAAAAVPVFDQDAKAAANVFDELLAVSHDDEQAGDTPTITQYVYDPDEDDPEHLKNRAHVTVPLSVEDVTEMIADKKATDVIELHINLA